MLKLILPTTLTTVLLANVALSATAADINGDGMLTIDEVKAVMPEVTAESFSEMDTNADGALDAAEVEAAQSAGLMPS